MTTAEEIISTEGSMLRRFAKRAKVKENFLEGAVDMLAQMYAGELPEEDMPELTQRLEKLWAENHP